MTSIVSKYFSDEQLKSGFSYFQDKLIERELRTSARLKGSGSPIEADPLEGRILKWYEVDDRLDELFKFQDFIYKGSSLNKFYDEAVELLVCLQDRDIESLDSKNPTKSAQKFLQLFDTLEENGVPSLENREIHFWSGDEARVHLSDPYRHLIDVKIPANSIILDFTRSLYPKDKVEQERYEDIRYRFIAAMSTYLASKAKKDVHVFISDQDKTGMYSMRVGNYFWNVESPVLQKLKRAGIVNNIWLHFQDNTKPSGWTQMEIESPESNNIQLVRVHLVAAKNEPNSYPSTTGKPFTMEPVETPCHINLGYMRKVIQKWRAAAQTGL